MEGREVKWGEKLWEKKRKKCDRRHGGTTLSGLPGVVPQQSLIAPPVFLRR